MEINSVNEPWYTNSKQQIIVFSILILIVCIVFYVKSQKNLNRKIPKSLKTIKKEFKLIINKNEKYALFKKRINLKKDLFALVF